MNYIDIPPNRFSRSSAPAEKGIKDRRWLNMTKQEIKEKVGAKIRKVRLGLGLTQAEMAEHFNIGRADYSRIEKGNIFPNCLVLYTLNSGLNVSMDWLFNGEERMQRLRKRAVKLNGVDPESVGEMDDLLDYMERIPMVKHAVLGFFLEYKLRNIKLIGKLSGKPDPELPE